ncbi:MAG: membrane lipoprotein lipid attachment site-containing protein [Melioribacteraceae bacterium]
MKKIILFVLLVGVLMLSGCSSSNLENVKGNAEGVWGQAGFKIIGYEGYQYGFTFPVNWNYGGAHVWYVVNKVPDNGITYLGCLQRWGNEYHIYNLKAVDAIKP